MKKSGRKGNTAGGLMNVLTSGWKRRWFVLVQADEGVDPSFHYYKSPNDLGQPLGTVIVSSKSRLFVATSDDSSKPSSFCVTSQGASDPRPITTVFAAKNAEDLNRWMKAVKRVISMSGGEVQKASEMQAAVKTRISPAVASLIALSKLDRDELIADVAFKKLYEVAAYLQIMLPPELELRVTKKIKAKDKNGSTFEYTQAKSGLVDLIKACVIERDALEKASAIAVPRKRKNSTWESTEGGMGAGAGERAGGRGRAPSVVEARPHVNGVQRKQGEGNVDYAPLY